MHKSYDKLQECYEALCEGQRLNPCEGDSSDGDNAFISCEGNNYDEKTQKNDEKIQKNDETITKQEKMELLKQWESKLHLNMNNNMVNNRGYLEPAADGQFDDVENVEKGNLKEGNAKIVIGINNGNNKVETPPFDPFHFAENIFDSNSKPPTPSLSGGDIDSIVKDIDTNNPYLDDEIMKSMQQFSVQPNQTFEKKYKSYAGVDVRNLNKMENDEKMSQQ
eukprot:UN07303